ncbi:uncharacterized protein LOC132613179 [Lycium barbarum]|uniref:uncharacterized protein LOC132613179 n=1 Tax=Lycium barbarum TaxID=112863 RepID=UPI00293F42B4|nr:uncharacterized protein LOC132613179 [Lycium barbarum]
MSTIPLKTVTFCNGVPILRWKQNEVEQMERMQKLQYAVIGKFSYGWPEMEELRTTVPAQCGIKGQCEIGLFRHRRVLIRLSLREDFINLCSKGSYYIQSRDGCSYQMRPLIYDTKFKIDEETSRVITWISFPDLMPTFFGQESLFSLASAVGIPLHLDKATENITRLSYAQIKVLLDLLADLPSYVNMEIEDDKTPGIRVDKGTDVQENGKQVVISEDKGNSSVVVNKQDMPVNPGRGKAVIHHEIPQNPIPEKKRKNQHNNKRRFNARLLASGKVLGDLGNWNVVKDNRVFDEPPSTRTDETTKKQSQQADDIVTHNKFDQKETEVVVEASIVVVNNGKKEQTQQKNALKWSEVLHKEALMEVETTSQSQIAQEEGLIEFEVDPSNEERLMEEQPLMENNNLALIDLALMDNNLKDTVGRKAEDINCLNDEEVFATVLDHVTKEPDLSPKSHVKGTRNAKKQELHKNMVVTIVYAKCDEVERVNLWDFLCNISTTMSMPWLTGGDFNVILNEEEKIGGLPVFPQEYEDFACCVNSCELSEVNFKGSPFTWWNGRTNGECIFKRLDRMLVNDLFQSWFGQIEVDHLSRSGSDHTPLLLSCIDQTQTFIKTFKFLKFWTEHVDFPDKLKSVKSALSQWSEHTFGDIFKQLSIREEIVRIKEELFEEFPTEGNRMILQRAQAELKKYMHYEEEFWRQKAGFDCFAEGDRNKRFFDNIVKRRRKRTQIKRIQNYDGTWIEGTDNLADEAISFYQKQFTQEPQQEEFSLLEHIQELVTEEDNVVFCSIASLEEVRQVVFELARDSVSGPDGLSGLFYQSCWHIVGVDVHKLVKAYFEGHTLAKSITHKNLVLLPKKNQV